MPRVPYRSSSASTVGMRIRLRDRLQHLVVAEHLGPHTIGIFDETSDPKKGDKTPGVQKQWCGRLGKTENCMVTVHLGLHAATSTACSTASCTCPRAGTPTATAAGRPVSPTTMTYRPKWQIALELFDRAIGNGLRFDWLTFDEGYGSKPELLRELTVRNQRYVAEVPRSFRGWLKRPRVVTRPFHRHGRGPGRKVPRLASGTPPARRVDELTERQTVARPALETVPGQGWREGANGLGV